MKIVAVLLFCAMALAEEDYLDTLVHRYHYHTLGADVVKAHMNCFLDKGPCDNIAASFKQILPEGISTKCKRCSAEQKNTAWMFLSSSAEIIPEELKKFKLKYDPDNKYFDGLIAVIKPNDE